MPLEPFRTPIGPYSAESLNDLLVTLFGEMSPQVVADSIPEAEAIASTVFNRHQSILDSRQTYNLLTDRLARAKKANDDAIKAYEDVSRNPSVTKKNLKDAGVPQDGINAAYAKRVKDTQEEYTRARNALGAAQNELNKASSDKTAAEAYVYAGSAKVKADITLTDVLVAIDPLKREKQYVGFSQGKRYVVDYPKLPTKDKERQETRWNIARDAIEKLAGNPAVRKRYYQFRSSDDGKRRISKNETRIGGNDFW